jgi:flagellar hook-length control protein FliK
MNSSAITNSTMPTVSIPGAAPSESAGSGFGDVMASITDKWSERSGQVKYDAAKSAQTMWDDNRADLDAQRKENKYYTSGHASTDDRRDDEPRRMDQEDRVDYDDHEDHARADDPKADDRRDVEANRHDEDSTNTDTQHADNSDDAHQDSASADSDSEGSDNSESAETASGEDTDGADQETLATNAGVVDPNQPVQAAPLPGSPEALELAKAKAAEAKLAAPSMAQATQTPEMANAQGQVAANADGTTDGLMGSTALSQPAAAASAKAALNGVDAGAGEEFSSDKFLSRVVDSMSGDGKAKTDSTGVTNASVNGQAASSNSAQQANAANPAQTAQAAQQAMAAAANAQTMQNNPTAAQNVATNGAVTATGGTEGATQAANGQLNNSNNLLQTNTGGQTAQTARQAPSQQVQQQVAVSIKNAASEGVDKISVQLRPEHLGRVDVKMEIGQDGRIQGVIQADTRETLDMLRQDSRALQQALKDAGLNADSQSFTFEHRDQGGQGQEGQSQSRMSADLGNSPDDGDVLSGAELAEHVGIGYGVNPNGLVDIRI